MSGWPGVHSGRTETFPPAICVPLRFVIGEIRQEFDAPRPSIQAGKSATRTSMGPPPKLRGLGWIWAVGKTAHFAGTEALPPVIPHTGTKLVALARRMGLGCGWPNQTRTHAPAAGLRERARSADPLLAAQTQSVFPWRARQCL